MRQGCSISHHYPLGYFVDYINDGSLGRLDEVLLLISWLGEGNSVGRILLAAADGVVFSLLSSYISPPIRCGLWQGNTVAQSRDT